jgi:phenylacetate-CoA ligase
MTEAGPIGFECRQAPLGMHVMENEFIAEVIDPATGRAAPEGQAGELVLTNLGRWGSPLIRYRTGDQVRLARGRCACGRTLARMEGGIIGRIDDMICVRGTNVFPASIEAIVRRFDAVEEFRAVVDSSGVLPCLRIEIEPARGADGELLAASVSRAVADQLLLGAKVVAVGRGTLERAQMKSRRLVREGLKAGAGTGPADRCNNCDPEVRSTCESESSSVSLSC